MLNIKSLKLLCIFFTFTLLSFKALASDPVVFLEDTTGKVMSSLEKNKAAIKTNKNVLYKIVDDLILPYVDFNEMGRWIAGKNIWDSASAVQKKEFINKFKTLVVRTYANALQKYVGQQIEFRKSRSSSDASRVLVLSVIKQSNGPSTKLDYRLIKSGDSWKVYDLVIEGVSLLKGYQSQFSNPIRQKGLQEGIKMIDEHLKKG